MNRNDELVTALFEDEDDWTPCWSPLDFLDASYVPALFGTVPVLVTPELADRIRAVKAGA